jgi:type II secretory pathway component GspD/PulD (secretin)
MTMSCDVAGQRLSRIGVFAVLALTATMFAVGAAAQTQSAEQKPAEVKPGLGSQQIFTLTNAYRQMDLNDVQTELRNMLPRARIYGVQSQNAIVIQGTAEELAVAQKTIAELDRSRKVYRLTYTITDMDGGKRVGAERFSVLVSSGGKAALKQGSRVPIVTGDSDAGAPPQNTQVQYQDIGLSIEASLDGDSLHSKVVLTSVAEEKSSVGAADPIIRQTVLEDSSYLTVGKSVVLGALDIAGGTRHQEIEVAAELVP